MGALGWGKTLLADVPETGVAGRSKDSRGACVDVVALPLDDKQNCSGGNGDERRAEAYCGCNEASAPEPPT